MASHDIDPLGRSSEPGIQEEEDSFAFEDVFAFQGTQEPLFVKKGIYQEVKAHNMTTYPWSFDSNKYDGLMCNGVLIYVDDPNCLEEFVRVTKPGGVCVIMFRHDGYPDYEAKDMALRAAGKWELIHKSPDMRNFDTVEYDSDQDVWFNQWVFRVLETSA